MPTISLAVFLLTLAQLLHPSCPKILQITQKNLPTVLKTQPSIIVFFHDPSCQYSINYKHKFTHTYHSSPQSQSHTVGIVDCSQDTSFCEASNITEFPTLMRMVGTATWEKLVPDVHLASVGVGYQGQQEYLAALVAEKLKQSPHFVVVLFEEEGMPVPQASRLKQHKYSDRVFYMSEGRLARTLKGFVNNREGCWIYELVSEETGQMRHYYCGDTYQNLNQLENELGRFINKIEGNQTKDSIRPYVLDKSSDDEFVIGYIELLESYKKYQTALQLAKSPKVSICSFLYIWEEDCQHCDYNTDVAILKRVVADVYTNRHKKQAQFKFRVHSYNVKENSFTAFTKEKIEYFTGLKLTIHGITQQQIKLIPNIYAMCLSTKDKKNLLESAKLSFEAMDHTISSVTIRSFIQGVIERQESNLNSKQAKQQDGQL